MNAFEYKKNMYTIVCQILKIPSYLIFYLVLHGSEQGILSYNLQ